MDIPGSTSDYQSALSALSTPVFSDNVRDLLGVDTSQKKPSAIISVNSTADVVDGKDGVTTLREAINQANADNGEDLIVFDRSLFSTAQTISLKLGELDITHNLNIIAPRDTLTGGNLVEVSGNKTSRVFEIEKGATVTFDGLIIADASGNNPNDFGGGINNSGTLTLNNSIVRNNTFTSGGGIYNIGSITVSNSTISNNSAFALYNSASGGGIYNIGSMTVSNSTISNNLVGGVITSGGSGIYNIGSMTVSNSTISNNSFSARDALGGGGIYNIGSMTVSNSTISNNSANALYTSGGVGIYGGGIYNKGGIVIVNKSNIDNNRSSSAEITGGGGIYNTGGTVTVSDSTINGNSSNGRGARGGGIFNDDSGTVTLLHSTISSNTLGEGKANDGGGIFNNGMMTVSNSTISDNYSGGNSSSLSSNGGGIINYGILTVSNSTISNNRTGIERGPGIFESEGGGIYNSGKLTLVFSTITQNLSSNGGGVFNRSSSSPNVRNTIIASNLLSTNNVNPDVAGSFSSNGYNLIGDSTGSTGFGVIGDIVGTSDNPIDPRLAPLDLYGGFTKTIALFPDSPAIDAGDPAVLDTDPTTDQRGFSRVSGARADIGAFEFYA